MFTHKSFLVDQSLNKHQSGPNFIVTNFVYIISGPLKTRNAITNCPKWVDGVQNIIFKQKSKKT